jgi:hypothetical protein
MSRKIFCSRITRVLSCWKRTERLQAASTRSTDRVSKEEVSVVWCPTGDMIGDEATKPLQGALFRKVRDHIMGVVPARYPGPGRTDGGVGKSEINKKTSLVPLIKGAAPQECVGSGTRDRVKCKLGSGSDGWTKRTRDPSKFNVNTSGKASAQILHLPLGDDSSPSVDNAVGR